MPPTRMVVVDGHELVRAGLAALLSNEPDIHVEGVAPTADAGLDMIEVFRPDVVLVDAAVPGMNPVEFCRHVSATSPGTAVVVLSPSSHHEMALRALEAGARGYVCKDVDGDELVRAIRTVAQGGAVLDPKVTGLVLASARGHAPTASAALSRREVEVLRRAARGATNKEIAQEFGISPNTVKTILARLMKKLDTHTRSEAAVTAIERGLI